MNFKIHTVWMSILLAGCSIGYNRAVFSTKSSIGIDIDNSPPTSDIAVARREGVIAPTFENAQTPPVLASFKMTNSALSSFFFGVGSTFAGGDAAIIMTKLYNEEDHKADFPGEFDSSLFLSQKPDIPASKSPISSAKAAPFVFGTDTLFGLKVVSGVSPFPDTLKLGYNRKEFACAPIFGKEEEGQVNGQPYKYRVKMPSFLATIDNTTAVKGKDKPAIRHLQYFATGKAAEFLALRKRVREAMLERADPLTEMKVKKYSNSDTTNKLRTWAAQDRKKNQAQIRQWMNSKNAEYDLLDFLNDNNLETEREQFYREKAQELNIP